MKYQTIQSLTSSGHALKACCELLNVSTSGYYKNLCRKPSKREGEDEQISEKIIDIFHRNRSRYGAPRIKQKLASGGVFVSRRRISRLMEENGLRWRAHKAFKPRTTITDPKSIKSPRIFKTENTLPKNPDKVWCSDLTYISLKQRFVYLVVVMDICTREIKAWRLSDNMKAIETQKTFQSALPSVSGRLDGLIFHSDQGSQYSANELREDLKVLGVTQSMSRRGNCYDNCFVESFFHTLKSELDLTECQTMLQMESEIDGYISWYNEERIHSSLGYVSPKRFKQLALAA